jgi:hypothetical protein
MTRNNDAGTFAGYLGQAKDSSVPLQGWPMHAWQVEAAGLVDAEAPASVEAARCSLTWMSYKHSRDTQGGEHVGAWDALVDYLRRSVDVERSQKLDMVVWMPTHCGVGRKDANITSISCLVLDSDTGVDHLRMHDVLCRAGLAHFGHASPSSTDETPKWRLVLPLAEPIKGDELTKWTTYYTAARLIFGAAGKVWFDASCGNRARIWYAGRLPETTTREVWGSHLVDVSTSPYRHWRALDIRALAAAFERNATVPTTSAMFSTSAVMSSPSVSSVSPLNRCRAYLANVEAGADGGTRNPARYRAATIAVKDFALSDSDAFEALSEWNLRCSPPAPNELLWQAIRNAKAYGKHASGELLAAAPPPRFTNYALRNTKAGASYRGAGSKTATAADHDAATAEHAIRAGCDDVEAVSVVLSRPDGHAAQQGQAYAEQVVSQARARLTSKRNSQDIDDLVSIDRVEIQTSVPPIYTLHIGEATVRVSAAELASKQRLSIAIMEAIHCIPLLPPTRNNEYEQWVNSMLKNATKVDVGEDASVDFGEREELEHIISTMPQSEDPDRLPNGCLLVSTDSPEVELALRPFMMLLRQSFPSMTRPTVVRHLRALGWSDGKRNIDGKETRIWRGKL